MYDVRGYCIRFTYQQEICFLKKGTEKIALFLSAIYRSLKRCTNFARFTVGQLKNYL